MTIPQLIERAKLGSLKKSFYQHLITLYLNEQFTDLELVLQACPESERLSDWHRLFAKCLIAKKEFAEAYEVLSRVPEVDQRHLNKDLLVCCEHLSFVEQGITLSSVCFEETSDIYFLLKKIKFLKMAKRHEEALAIYDEFVKNPHYQELIIDHLQYLSELNHPLLPVILNKYIATHPENTHLRMIQFWHAYRHKSRHLAFNMLLSIIYLFPVCIEAHLALIKFHVDAEELTNAAFGLIAFKDKFKTQQLAIDLMQALVIENPCLSLAITSRFPHQVKLPTLIRRVFSILNVPGTALYLVGSTIHNLLEGRPLTELADIDFVSNQPPLPSTLFFPSPFMPRLYSNFITDEEYPDNPFKCECFYNPEAPENMIELDVRNRDFTINSLYCDAEGKLIDPTGLGFLDLEYRIIRTIIASRTSLDDDPIRILRAIKLILRGFRVTPELDYALHHWMPTEALVAKIGHINAVMAKLLKVPADTENLIRLLKHYHLLNKIYSINTSSLDDAQIYSRLVYEVNRSSPRMRA